MMRLNYILAAISSILIGFGFMFFLPIIVAVYYHDYASILPFTVAGIIALFLGGFSKTTSELSS